MHHVIKLYVNKPHAIQFLADWMEFKMFHFNFPYTVNDRRCERDIIKRDDSHNK